MSQPARWIELATGDIKRAECLDVVRELRSPVTRRGCVGEHIQPSQVGGSGGTHHEASVFVATAHVAAGNMDISIYARYCQLSMRIAHDSNIR